MGACQSQPGLPPPLGPPKKPQPLPSGWRSRGPKAWHGPDCAFAASAALQELSPLCPRQACRLHSGAGRRSSILQHEPQFSLLNDGHLIVARKAKGLMCGPLAAYPAHGEAPAALSNCPTYHLLFGRHRPQTLGPRASTSQSTARPMVPDSYAPPGLGTRDASPLCASVSNLLVQGTPTMHCFAHSQRT